MAQGDDFKLNDFYCDRGSNITALCQAPKDNGMLSSVELKNQFVYEGTCFVFVFFVFFCSFLNRCGCSTAKSKTPPQETIFLPTRRWYIAQREAHSPDCYIRNFRVTSAEHDTLQFCMDWTVGDSSVAVCIEVGFWCVEQHHAWSEHLRRVSTADIEANIRKKDEQEEIVKEIQVCAK